MFPTSRPCTSHCLRTLTKVVPRYEAPDPLLFLYPPWFRRGWLRHQHTGLVPGSENEIPVNESNNESRNLRSLPITRYAARKSNKSTAKTQQIVEKHVKGRLLDWRQTSDLGSSCERQGVALNGSVSEEGPTPDGTEHAAQGASHQLKASSTAKSIARKVQSKGENVIYKPGNLRIDVLVDMLLSHSSPVYDLRHDTETIQIDTDTLIWLTGSTDENMWLHHDGSGCAVCVLPAQNEEFGRRTLSLRGSSRAREIAKNSIEKCESRFDPTNAGGYLEGQSIDWLGHVNHVPQPAEWNLRTLHEYIRVITSFKPRRSVTRYLYGNTSYHEEVGRILESLFTRPECRAFLSTKALQRALQFCRLHNELSGVATHIMAAAIAHGLRPGLASYNEEIGRALANGNEKQCLHLIKQMSEFDLHPNVQTWSVLFSYIDNATTREKIVDRFKEDGLFQDPSAKIVIANAFIRKDFHFFVGKSGGTKYFLQRMNGLFGNGWLDNQGVTRMLRACRNGSYPHFEANQVLAIANEAKQNGIEMTASSLIELLRISCKMANMKDTVEILKTAPLRNRRANDQILINTVFGLAWRRQWYNISRLLWHYAASAGIITFEMLNVVKHGLTTNITKVTNNSSLRIWNLVAGKFIVGTNLDTTDFEKLFGILGQQGIEKTPMKWFLQWTHNDGTRNDQMMLAHLVLERDLNAWRFFKSIQWDRFLELLDRALKMDLEWKEKAVPETQSDTWLIDHAIQIPLTPRQKSLSFQTRDLQNSKLRQWFIVNGHKLDMTTLQLVKDFEGEENVARRSNRTKTNVEHEAVDKKTENSKPMSALQLHELTQAAQLMPRYKPPRIPRVQIRGRFPDSIIFTPATDEEIKETALNSNIVQEN